MIMEPKGVKGFLAIVENGNFEKAAKKLGITTSALSVSTLERIIGGKLLIRKRPFVLTETGNIFYRHAVQLRDLENSLREKIEKIAC
jgi:DNA-binding transcriptional LysR family regulator